MIIRYPLAASIALLPLAVVHIAIAADRQMVPFVIPALPEVHSLSAYPPSDPIGVSGPRVVAANSHFSVGGKPIKFWGVNLTFAANFPDHADAEPLAVRLSQAGINCVRLHHMDMAAWNGKTGIWDPANPKVLSAEAVDRLDYLIDRLAAHGIYADLNLHVSRTHSTYLGLPPVPGVSYDKMTDLFMPPIIEAEKDYARQLLGHVNAYRGVRYADDPAIAIVEISNEDSFFEWGGQSHLEALPELYARTLQSMFCDWLARRYGSTAALRAAWSKEALPPGEELIVDRHFKDPEKNWFLETHDGSSASLSPIEQTAHLNISRADGTTWHIQFQQGNLHLQAGQYYTLKFSARADRARHLQVSVDQAHAPWGDLGLWYTISIDNQWKSCTYGFTATGTDDAARLCFGLAEAPGEVDLKDVSLRIGGREGLKDDESLEARNIALFAGSQTERRSEDVQRFLADTQKAFYDGMNRFIKTDLGCGALVTGTIVFGPLGLYTQTDMDFVDAHAYWQHPQFPGREWDMHNWTMNQIAMVDHPEQATLFQLGSSRLAGKPFTVTEYSHPAPNDYQAECVPEIATFAAAQNWDAVFLFDWGAVPSADHFESFFDVGANPAKLAFMSSAATIFRGEAIAPLVPSRVVSLAGAGDSSTPPAAEQIRYDLNMLGVVGSAADLKWQDLLTQRLYLSFKPATPNSAEGGKNEGTRIRWPLDAAGHGTFTAIGPGAFVWIGHSGAASDSPVTLDHPDFAAITLVALDGLPLRDSKRLLLTACGRCENTGMRFAPDRHTVIGGFGTGPVLIEAVEATIRIPGALSPGIWRLQPLNAAGRPMGRPHDFTTNPDGFIRIDADDETAWHLLTRN